MGIVPVQVKLLLDVYDELVDTSGDIVGAVSQIAPAAVREVLCKSGNFLDLYPDPIDRFLRPGSLPRSLEDLGGILQRACPVPPPLPQGGGFEGGQCEDVLYVVEYRLQPKNRFSCSIGDPIEGVIELAGPLRNFRLITPDIAFCDFGGTPYLSFAVDFGSTQQEITIRQAQGNDRLLSFEILSIARKDGLPDECGPPLPPPPQPPIPDLPESPTIPDDRPGGGGGGFVFKPTVGPVFIGPTGIVNVPVVVNIGGPSLNAPVTIPVNVALPSFEPTIVFGGGGGVAPPGTPSNPDDPPTPPPPVCCDAPSFPAPEIPGEEEEPVETGDPPPGLELAGVLVRSSINSARVSATQIFGDGGSPDLWVPRLASVYFLLDNKAYDIEGPPSYSRDYDVKVQSQFLEVPAGVKARVATATPQPGVALSVQPFYRRRNE